MDDLANIPLNNPEDPDLQQDIPRELQTQKEGGKYVCGWEAFKRPGARSLLKWKLLTKNESNIGDKKELEAKLPIVFDKNKVSNPPADNIQVTWLGHATVLFQIEGVNVLADPVFSDYCGPQGVSRLGYKRYRKPACEIRDLEGLIDVVIISHDHYDHLDYPSVKEITKVAPEAQWYVGEGLAEWMTSSGCKNVTERRWWQGSKLTVRDKDLTFTCVPTQHWCQRGIMDMNKTLWCSWVVKSARKSFYFAGDTGYHAPLFRKIGEKFGPFDVAAIPIGAYNPRFALRYQHVDPGEAVKIHLDTKSRHSIGIHWGTIHTMACEYYLEPPQEVEKEMKKAVLDPRKFFSLNLGESWCLGEDRDYDPPFMERKKGSGVEESPAH